MQAANPRSKWPRCAATLENPEVAKLVDLAGDMFSNEVFLYGDASCNDFTRVAHGNPNRFELSAR